MLTTINYWAKKQMISYAILMLMAFLSVFLPHSLSETYEQREYDNVLQQTQTTRLSAKYREQSKETKIILRQIFHNTFAEINWHSFVHNLFNRISIPLFAWHLITVLVAYFHGGKYKDPFFLYN